MDAEMEKVRELMRSSREFRFFKVEGAVEGFVLFKITKGDPAHFLHEAAKQYAKSLGKLDPPTEVIDVSPRFAECAGCNRKFNMNTFVRHFEGLPYCFECARKKKLL